MPKQTLSIVAESHIMKRLLEVIEEEFPAHNRWEPNRDQMAKEVAEVGVLNRFSLVLTGGNDHYTEGTKK